MAICNNCGSSIPDGALFCATCGNKIEAKSYVENNAAAMTNNYQQSQTEYVAQDQNPSPSAYYQQPQQTAENSFYQQPQQAASNNYYQQPQQTAGNGFYQQPQQTAPNGYYQQNQYNNTGNYYQAGQNFQQPDLNEPMAYKEWLITLLLLFIPVANIILLVIWGFFGNEKKSKVSFARAALTMIPIVFVIYFIILMIVGVSVLY